MQTDIKKLAKYCTSLGLTPKESTFYLTALELGPCNVQQIAQKMKIFRSSAYHLLDSLSRKGLISQEIKSYGRTVIAEPPTRLVQMLKSHKRKIGRQAFELEDQLPELMGFFNMSKVRPTIKAYEGAEGLKAIHDDILTTGKTMYCYPRLDKAIQVLPIDFQLDFVEKRVKRGIKAIALTYRSPAIEEVLSKTPDAVGSKGSLRELRILPVDVPLPAEKIIYGNKVALLAYDKKITGVVIEHPDVAEMERRFFKMLWKVSETAEDYIEMQNKKPSKPKKVNF